MSDTEETQTRAGDWPARGTSADVSALMQMLVEDRRWREEEFAEDRARQSREMERRVGEMREQMDVMVQLMEGSTKSKPPSGEALVKVAKLAETDDIEGYLLTFERQMVAYEVDKSRWAFILAPQLTRKAQKAYMALWNEEAGNYECIKRAILKRYDVSEESHRRKFRERSKIKEVSYSELATSLLDLANRWLEECSSREEVIEKLATEQASEDVRVWIREHKPKTCAEAGQWADEIQLARSDSRAPAPGPGPRRCHKCNQPGHHSNRVLAGSTDVSPVDRRDTSRGTAHHQQCFAEMLDQHSVWRPGKGWFGRER